MNITSEKRGYLLKLGAFAVIIVTAVVVASVILWGYVKPKDKFYIVFSQYPDASTETVLFSEDMDMPTVSDIDGYAFDGWYYEHEGTRLKFDPKEFDPSKYGYDGKGENFLTVYGKWSFKE